MGCNPSKSNGADAGTAVDVLEIGLELSDSDSRVLAENPLEVSREVVRESVSTVGAKFSEVRPQLKLMLPVALVGRCILNEMIDIFFQWDPSNDESVEETDKDKKKHEADKKKKEEERASQASAGATGSPDKEDGAEDNLGQGSSDEDGPIAEM